MNQFTTFNFINIKKAKIFVCFLCFIPFAALSQTQESQASETNNCHFLQIVEASSGYGKNMNWQSLAKYSALSKADKLGASHLVWERFYPIGAFNGIAVAKAYNCNS
jgi:fucose 4-O-acetylase-like acetyltransferase